MPDTPDSSQREKEVFYEVVDIDDPKKRAARLAELCGDDNRLRNRVERLLKLDEGGTAFMDEANIPIDTATPEARPLPEIITTPQESGTPAESYRIGPEIARGGMGQIRESEDIKLGRTVAIKILHEESGHDRTREARFLFEAKVLARLEHPNIVPIHDIVWEKGRPLFYSMKLVNGMTLQSILNDLRDQKPETLAEFPLAELLSIFQKVCDAMAFAHSRGIIHRDLKPENIMVGEFGEVLVMDWGIAKDLGSPDVVSSTSFLPGKEDNFQATLEGDVMGTPQYMSPEQAEGKINELDARSDIYSLGAILYAILTLRPPVEGETLAEVLKKVSSGCITSPTELRTTAQRTRDKTEKAEILKTSKIHPLPHTPSGRVPPALSSVAMQALRQDKKERYQTVEALSSDVEAYQRGFATEAEQAGPVRQIFLLLKRHRQATLILAGAMLAIVLITAFSFLQIQEKKNSALRALADSQRTIAEFAYASDDLGDMVKTLQSTPEEFRDGEWDYLMAKADTSFLTLPPDRGAPFTHITSHPSLPGVFAVGDRKGQVHLISALTGEAIDRLDSGFPTLHALALSADGQTLAAAFGRRIHFIDLPSQTIATKWKLDWPDSKNVDRIVFSPDSTQVVVESSLVAGLSENYSFPGKEKLPSIDKAMEHVFLSPPSSLAAISNSRIAVQDKSRNPPSIEIKGSRFRFWSLEPLHEERSFLSANVRGVVNQWKAPGQSPVWSLETGLVHPGLFLSADDQYVIVFGRSDAGSIMGKAYSRNHRTAYYIFHGAGVSKQSGGVTISQAPNRNPHGKRAFSQATNIFACIEGELKLWHIPFLSTDTTNSFSPCGDEFAFLDEDRIFRRDFLVDGANSQNPDNSPARNLSLFSLASSEKFQSAPPHSGRSFNAIAASRAGDRYATGTNSLLVNTFGIHLYDMQNGDTKDRVIDLDKPLLPLNRGLQISSDGRFVLAVTRDRTIRIYEFDTGQSIRVHTPDDSESIVEAKFIPGSSEIVYSTRARNGMSREVNRIVRWNFENENLAYRDFIDPIDDFDISPDGKKIAITSRPSHVAILSRDTLDDITRFRAHDTVVSSVAFQPQGEILTTASLDGSVKSWSLSDFKIRREWHCLSPVLRMQYSPRGARLAVYADPRTIYVIDLVAESQSPVPAGVTKVLEWKEKREAQ